jgi:hypothetical protein
MRRAAAAAGVSVDRFTLQGRFTRTPYYELRVEPAGALAPQDLAEQMDFALAELNVEYHAKRAGGRLGPIRTVLVEPGSFEGRERETIRRRYGRGEQYKHKYLLTDVLEGEA